MFYKINEMNTSDALIKSKKESLLIENQYFPCVNWINTSFQFSNILIEQYESWQKMSFRNRCVVAGSNGPVNLSVPLENGRGQRELVKDVRVSRQVDWQKQHWRTIESCYNRSPFFEFYRDSVFDLLQKRQVFLFDMNLSILEWLFKVLGNTAPVSLTETYKKEYDDQVADLRDHFTPKSSGGQPPSGVRYTQVFEERTGFLPNLSILDLLFCSGPNAKTLLKDSKIVF